MQTLTEPTLPLVSICTPTRDRLGFLPLLLRCIQQQTYPQSKIEWVVVDDGVDSSESICTQFANTRFVRLDPADDRIPLGCKRNLSHLAAQGEILLYMDDDDYYPPCRVAHAVKRLLGTPNRLIAGSSILPIHFTDRGETWMVGPYGPNHATAATFAFRRELLEETAYDEQAKSAEEYHFLKGYTIPMVQLESTRTILAFSHAGNTYDKRQLLRDPTQKKRIRRAAWPLSKFIADRELRAEYLAAATRLDG